MAAQNGVGGGNAAMYSGMNGSIMPAAGHYSDMQTLMQNMEALSGVLQQNREDWQSLQDGLARAQVCPRSLRRKGEMGRAVVDRFNRVDMRETTHYNCKTVMLNVRLLLNFIDNPTA